MFVYAFVPVDNAIVLRTIRTCIAKLRPFFQHLANFDQDRQNGVFMLIERDAVAFFCWYMCNTLATFYASI